MNAETANTRLRFTTDADSLSLAGGRSRVKDKEWCALCFRWLVQSSRRNAMLAATAPAAYSPSSCNPVPPKLSTCFTAPF